MLLGNNYQSILRVENDRCAKPYLELLFVPVSFFNMFIYAYRRPPVRDVARMLTLHHLIPRLVHLTWRVMSIPSVNL